MALPDILDAIAGEADREVAALRAQADAEVAAILARADAEVAALDRQCEERRGRYVATTVARIVNSARLDAIRRAQGAREDVAAKVMAGVREELSRMPDRPDHGAVLARWLAELRASLPEGTRVRVTPAAASAAFAPDLIVEADAALDGVVLETPDGRVAVATVAVRTARAEPAIRQAVARELAR